MSKLPDGPYLLQLHRQGVKDAEIARRYDSSRSAVSQAMARAGRGPVGHPHSVYREEIPWRVKVEHASDYAVKMLRAYGAEKRGNPLSAKKAGQLALFKRRMDENNTVVAYDPDRGFYLVPRRKGDVGYTRKP